MAKNLLYVLFLSMYPFWFTQVFATNEIAAKENHGRKTDICNAPAPDSFHVTTSGYNFVTLVWNPTSLGATHTIVVLTQIDSTSSWIPVDTIFNVPGTSCKVSIMQFEPTKCGFTIATNCINGEPGDDINFASPPIALILELILAGRTPHNPTTIAPCTPIKAADHNWIGFSVSNGDGFNLITNTFEVVINNDHPVVKRVNEPPLVAGNEYYEYPKTPPKNFINFYGIPPATFKVFLVNAGNSYMDIGYAYIAISQLGSNKMITICQINSLPWDNKFSFKVLTATSANGLASQIIEDRSNINSENKEKIIVQTPFSESLSIVLPESISQKKQIAISLWNVAGQLILDKHYVSVSNQISFPSETLSSGYYYLRIVYEGEAQTFKILKVY